VNCAMYAVSTRVTRLVRKGLRERPQATEGRVGAASGLWRLGGSDDPPAVGGLRSSESSAQTSPTTAALSHC
jgi:hypothetical protein